VGLTKDIKRQEHYEKPSERRRRASRKSVARRAKDDFVPMKAEKKTER
jgi:ribosomal protein S21